MIELDKGQTERMKVFAAKKWNRHPSGLWFRNGHHYRLTVEQGSVENWKDGGLPPTDPAGNMPTRFWLVPWVRRYRGAPWYALVGTVCRKHPFLIGGEKADYRPPADGEFMCYANDFYLAYRNNKGSLTLCIERLK